MLLKVGVSLSLLALLLWRTDRSGLVKLLFSLDLPFFSTAVLLYLLGQAMCTYRWQTLLEAEGIRMPYLKLVGFYFEGMFFNLFLPTLIGGDVVKGHHIYQYTAGKEASLASILVDRLTGLTSLLGIALLALFLGGPSLRDPAVTWPILGTAFAFAVGCVAVLHPRLKPFFEKLPWGRFAEKVLGFYQALQRYRGHRKALGQAVALSVVFQAMVIYSYYLIAKALGLTVPLGPFFLLVPVVIVIAMIPVSLGGLGIREGAVIYLFGKVGVESTSALAMSLTWFLLVILASLPGGLLFALQDHQRKAADRHLG
ncbi:MAG: flippase-like domain-containing protein [candidate division NC10 bacterium]|nr:flippase-like domain-containing protein [candidate division NC10 bacterium]